MGWKSQSIVGVVERSRKYLVIHTKLLNHYHWFDTFCVLPVSLGLPEHSVILDVKTRWNSLYLMMERFLEMFPAIQAACMDPRLKKFMEKERFGICSVAA